MILKPLKFPQKVTLGSVGSFCLIFLGFSFFFPQDFKIRLKTWTGLLLEGFGFYYLLLGIFAVLVLIFLAFSKWGKTQLGSDKAEYGWFSWIAMLYSTGMGAGLLLRAVQEPVYYFQNPPRDSSLSQAGFALEYTFFHWGLTPWAFYGLFGLLMAYIMHIKKDKALSSSILPSAYQNSPTGVLMNVLTIICTLLGVVAALGLGGRQLLQALGYVNGIETQPLQAIYIVILISFLATGSALLGLSKGIRNLSNFNIGLATLLLGLVAVFGIQQAVNFEFFGILGTYLYEFIPMSLNLWKFEVSQDFLKDWTYFYWAFWLAWAPFTGIFIARISKGRSIREFVLAVLIIPTLGTFLWFTTFGQNAFQLLSIGEANWQDFESIYTGIFIFLDYFPLAALTKTMTLVLVFTFLITSVDSAIFVLSMFSDGGNPEPSKRFRWIWGMMIGLFTIGLILIGKEALLESVSQLLIVFALPFSLMFLGMVLYFIRLLFWKKTTI
jgi:glycine betaine transporter